MDAENCLRFVPSRVDGVRDVDEVAVHPDRLELRTSDHQLVYRFHEIAQWPKPSWFWRLLARIGLCRKLLPVGERDWFHPPCERYFRFFTNPRITIYMPDEPSKVYAGSFFRRVEDRLCQGGFCTWDLG